MNRLKDKIAVITGGGSGIGRSTSILFAREGATVVVVDIDSNSGNETVRLITSKDGRADFVLTNVGNSENVKRMIDHTIAQYERLDVLFNNAGVAHLGSVVDISEAMWDETILVNLKGVFLGMKYAIPHMIKQGGGSIINTASVNGLVALRNEAAYDSSKAGVVLLTKATALDFGMKKIRVNCICPGPVDSPQLHNSLRKTSANYQDELRSMENLNAAFHRLIRAEEVAQLALFLASDDSSAMTGGAYVVDGGYTAI